MGPRGMTVAVVDDEASVRKALTRLLRAAGYEAKAYASGEEFLDALAHERFGCLILDLQMPGMSGLDVQNEPGFLEAAVPTIVISARDEHEARESCLAAGVFAYLPKPVDDAELLAAVQAASDPVARTP
jgi:FixJ family two-component response regulator